uniref:Core Histone H2A/H2B/H3 domain-containing protein n=2 Tax=Salix TaxID=40685 RepID=A0A6N2NLG9_SALVM
MDNTTTNHQPQPTAYPPHPTNTTPPPGGAPSPTPFHHLLQQQQQQLQMFWSYQRQEIEQVNDFKNHQLPLARIKKIMKADEDVRMISAEAPILFAKACELFILELTIRSWLHAEENKRRTLQKNDIAAAITRTDIFDFLVDIVPRDEIKEEAAGLGGIVGATASGVPYYYPPMGQPAAATGGMMIGRPAMDPATGMYVQPPSQAWQSVWQTSATEDGSYGSGGASGGQGNLDGQGPQQMDAVCDLSILFTLMVSVRNCLRLRKEWMAKHRMDVNESLSCLKLSFSDAEWCRQKANMVSLGNLSAYDI